MVVYGFIYEENDYRESPLPIMVVRKLHEKEA